MQHLHVRAEGKNANTKSDKTKENTKMLSEEAVKKNKRMTYEKV